MWSPRVLCEHLWTQPLGGSVIEYVFAVALFFVIFWHQWWIGLCFFIGQSTSERIVLCLMACLSSASSPLVALPVSLRLGTHTEHICTSYLWLKQPVFFCRSQLVQWSWTDSRPTSPWTGPEDFTTPRSPRPPDSVTSMTLCWPSWSCSSRF